MSNSENNILTIEVQNEFSKEWANNLKPLVELLRERTITFLDKLKQLFC